MFNSFSQDDPTGVRDKLRIAIENKEVKLEDENSVSQIIGVLDKWFKKDDLTEMCENWNNFVRYH